MSHKSEDRVTALVQDILRVAHDLKEATAHFHSPGHSFTRIDNLPVAVDSINLPSPPPLLPSLLDTGIDSEVAAVASQIYQRCAEQLREHIQQSITAACRTTAEFPVHASLLPPDLFAKRVISIFTDVYLDRLRKWKGETIQRIKQAMETPPKAASKNSHTFNHEYVPLLERFFKENPFPTHADKMLLAKRSNMQYRQIHVWFQNRRNRTKKEDRLLRKKPICQGAMQPSNRLYERMRGCVASESPASEHSKVDSSGRVSEKEVTPNDALKDSFSLFPPLHAFPLPYPPTCPYDPFPCKSGTVHFSKPEWRRIPNGTHPPPLSISVDDLVEKFSHLNVRAETRSKGSTRWQSHAATAAVTVIPSCAPHPALMTRKHCRPTTIVHFRPPIPTPVSHFKVFQSPSPTSKPLTLVPLSVLSAGSEFPRKRKIAPLPQRLPSQRHIRRGTTPSKISSTSSSPCFFSTDSESCSSSPSAISLSTPSDIGSVRELPYSFGLSCHSPLDSPILRGSGDMATILPLPVL